MAFISTAFRLKNCWSVLQSHYLGRRLPALKISDSIAIEHNSNDAMFIVNEIVVGECYTSKGFYSPKDGDVVIDVGANIGVFAMYLQTLARVQVYSFEPAPSTREMLERNVANNNLSSQIRVVPVAIGKEAGTLSLRCSPNFGHSSFYEGDHLKDAVEVSVPVATLPSQFSSLGISHVDLLKIDIEGAEVALLEGMTPEAWKMVQRVTIETHDAISQRAHELCTKCLLENGFDVHSEKQQGGLGYVNASRVHVT